MRVLTEADIERLLPSPARAVELAREALLAIADGEAQVPPKPTVRLGGQAGAGAFANAMPAAYPERNLLGCKWISIVPDNVERGLPTASGLVVVNDAVTGMPRAVLPAGGLTALRTAAVTGACVAALADPGEPVAVLGAGVQVRSHLRVLETLGHTDVTVWARRPQALDELVAWAATEAPQVTITRAPTRAAAAGAARVVVTALAIGAPGLHLDPSWVRDDALLLPLDYSSCVGPALARTATLVADHPEQFEALRLAGSLGPDYPGASGPTGSLLTGPRHEGRVVCQNLGNGLVDLVVADAVATAAETQGAGHVVDT
ncbi:ornithine cyclodeaminase family protein [Knoellia koreensis]|uniref:Ornithine cyclodeaminase family protein n=1 Tax=Knoellia koreensis TaxID=2730921 RepID=A0A849HAP9_9MICO|nr:ornithine cyclodeaminase family protein [Knoellia sp. DB2414S]NNM44488.1 ornithine cyclodeaminase family protein [Knoellia sp. DB2414S]